MARVKPHHRVHDPRYKHLVESSRAFGERDDCAVVAVAAIVSITYQEAHSLLESMGRERNSSTPNVMILEAIRSFGFSTSKLSVRKIIDSYPGNNSLLKNMTLHHPVRFPESFPNGKLIAFSKFHVSAIINREVIDYAKGSTKRIHSLYRVSDLALQEPTMEIPL